MIEFFMLYKFGEILVTFCTNSAEEFEETLAIMDKDGTDEDNPYKVCFIEILPSMT